MGNNPLARHSYETNGLGNRIEYKERVIVLSGDTVKTEYIVRYAGNSGIPVHGTIDAAIRKKVTNILYVF